MKPLDEAEKQAIREYLMEIASNALENAIVEQRQLSLDEPGRIDDLEEFPWELNLAAIALVENGFLDLVLELFPQHLKEGKSLQMDIDIAIAAMEIGLVALALERAESSFGRCFEIDWEQKYSTEELAWRLLALCEVFQKLGNQSKAEAILTEFRAWLHAIDVIPDDRLILLRYCARLDLQLEACLILTKLEPLATGLSFSFSSLELLKPFANPKWAWLTYALAGKARFEDGKATVMTGAMKAYIDLGDHERAFECMLLGDEELDEKGKWNYYGKELAESSERLNFQTLRRIWLRGGIQMINLEKVIALHSQISGSLDSKGQKIMRNLLRVYARQVLEGEMALSNIAIGNLLKIAILMGELDLAYKLRNMYNPEARQLGSLYKASFQNGMMDLAQEFLSQGAESHLDAQLLHIQAQFWLYESGKPNSYQSACEDLRENLHLRAPNALQSDAIIFFSRQLHDFEQLKLLVKELIKGNNLNRKFRHLEMKIIARCADIHLFVQASKHNSKFHEDFQHSDIHEFSEYLVARAKVVS